MTPITHNWPVRIDMWSMTLPPKRISKCNNDYWISIVFTFIYRMSSIWIYIIPTFFTIKCALVLLILAKSIGGSCVCIYFQIYWWKQITVFIGYLLFVSMLSIISSMRTFIKRDFQSKLSYFANTNKTIRTNFDVWFKLTSCRPN